jgi:hypothetical protein
MSSAKADRLKTKIKRQESLSYLKDLRTLSNIPICQLAESGIFDFRRCYFVNKKIPKLVNLVSLGIEERAVN